MTTTKTACDGCKKVASHEFYTLDWVDCYQRGCDENTEGSLFMTDREAGVFCPDCWKKMTESVKK